MGLTDYLFKPGHLTTVMDGGAGSSGKGRIGSYITENADNWQFACNTFMPQAGHWVRKDDGRQFFYQTLSSCAYQIDKYEKMYIGPGSIIELPAFFREMEENKVPSHKIGISPAAAILQQMDTDYERGLVGFDGEDVRHEGTMKKGSTAHGVGAALARRALRRPSSLLAKDIPELKDFICDVPNEVLGRLDRGQSGFLEIAQGFQLSLMHQFFLGYTTSRNVTVAQGLSDMFLPTRCAGPVVINFRTYPIRINSNKYIGDDGKHLTWAEVEAGVPHKVYEGNSGPWYPDQKELSWKDITKISGSKEKIEEITSVTKLPRRVFTFSRQNVAEAIRYNDTGHGVYLSLNFLDYADVKMKGARIYNGLTPKVIAWMRDNFGPYTNMLRFLGTGAKTEDTILLNPAQAEGIEDFAGTQGI